jgi:hypothetical protein
VHQGFEHTGLSSPQDSSTERQKFKLFFSPFFLGTLVTQVATGQGLIFCSVLLLMLSLISRPVCCLHSDPALISSWPLFVPRGLLSLCRLDLWFSSISSGTRLKASVSVSAGSPGLRSNARVPAHSHARFAGSSDLLSL